MKKISLLVLFSIIIAAGVTSASGLSFIDTVSEFFGLDRSSASVVTSDDAADRPLDNNYFALSTGTPFTQAWSNAGLITADDDWSGVPSINGYRGDDATAGTGVDPQTVLMDYSAVIDVNANRSDPDLFITGGVTEFDGIANPVVALQGSGTADFPHLDIRLNTTGCTAPNSINVAYNVRDVDGSADNAIQQVALHYRVGGGTGAYANIPGGYIPDATTGGSATQVTPVSVTLPADSRGQSQVHLRVMTSNALGSDEWVGIDDINITCGAGGGTPNPTPTQSPGGGTPTPTPTPSPSASPSPVASPSPTVPPVPFVAGHLVLYRVGDGTAALTSAATTVFLDEFTTAGAFVQSIRMPVAGGGANRILTASGTSTAEGMLTRSVDGAYLVLTGYDKAPGGANPSADLPSVTNRVIGRVAANASVDTSTALNDPTSNVRSAASTNGIDMWLTSSGNGSRYTTFGTATSTQLATTPTNLRATAIFSGQLYISSATGTFQGISTVGTGLPTTTGQTITLLNGFPTAAGPSPIQFAFFNANTLYVADDRAIASGGGVQKWTQSAGTWTLVNTFNNGLTAGVRGLTLTTNGSNQPVIYASTADSLSKLVTVTDDGTATPMFATLATTGANTAWRGVAFVPGGAVVHTQHFLDFNGDGRTDYGVTRDEGGLKRWYVLLNGSTSFLAPQWGIATDREVPADYDGDGHTDFAVFRDSADPNRAFFYILRSSNATVQIEQFGRQGDSPKVVGDYDGDGKTDVAVFRDNESIPCGAGHSVFYWRPSNSPGTNFSIGCWGITGDKPYVGDFDGDGRTDLGVLRFNGNQTIVYIRRSSDQGIEGVNWGLSGDGYFPCDYDADGKNDICAVRVNGTNAEFYILTRTGGGTGASPIIFGNINPNVDQLAWGDYDGDGRTDMGILHPSGGSTMFIYRKSNDGTFNFVPWGLTGDHSLAESFTQN